MAEIKPEHRKAATEIAGYCGRTDGTHSVGVTVNNDKPKEPK